MNKKFFVGVRNEAERLLTRGGIIVLYMTIISSFSEAALNQDKINQVGFYCDRADQLAGNGEDFKLSFKWSKENGIYDTQDAVTGTRKRVQILQDKGKRSLIVYPDTSDSENIEVLVFTYQDLLSEQKPFDAELFKGQKKDYSAGKLIKTRCIAPAGIITEGEEN